MPPSRSAGIASSAPTAAAIAMPTAMPTNTETPQRVASCPHANAPIAANEPCASEISPAIPVNTVIDRKMIAKITAWVASESQYALPTNANQRHEPDAHHASRRCSVARVRPGPRSTAASAGGGGSTPASGSVNSRFRFNDGLRIRTKNSTTNGSDGRRPWAMMLFVGRVRDRICAPMPSARPPTSASGRLDRPANAAAAIAATMSRKKFCDDSCGNSGPSSTPAIPARMLESAQPTDETRSALIPASSVMRALSTTARMRRPMRRVAEHEREADDERERHDDRRELVAVDRVAEEVVRACRRCRRCPRRRTAASSRTAARASRSRAARRAARSTPRAGRPARRVRR